jgi:hypothetical protein
MGEPSSFPPSKTADPPGIGGFFVFCTPKPIKNSSVLQTFARIMRQFGEFFAHILWKRSWAARARYWPTSFQLFSPWASEIIPPPMPMLIAGFLVRHFH